jgi:ssDNA-binding Zn-finger/Zn-ribbon topoisomerase 1
MKLEIKCSHCLKENVVINNKLFFSEEPQKTKVYCSICSHEMVTLETDGWFFVQSLEQYDFDLKIEKQKEILKSDELHF